MSREIKFRAWDKDLERYYYDAQNCYDFLTGLNAYCFGDLLSNDNYEIEQYTGLKDKNGKEIYEGDIVMMLDYHSEIAGIMECLKTDIRWDKENACYVLGVTEFGSKLLLHNPETYVIVGNIHENPGLLISYQQGELNNGGKKNDDKNTQDNLNCGNSGSHNGHFVTPVIHTGDRYCHGKR